MISNETITDLSELENFLYFLQDKHMIKIINLSMLQDRLDQWEDMEEL